MKSDWFLGMEITFLLQNCFNLLIFVATFSDNLTLSKYFPLESLPQEKKLNILELKFGTICKFRDEKI